MNARSKGGSRPSLAVILLIVIVSVAAGGGIPKGFEEEECNMIIPQDAHYPEELTRGGLVGDQYRWPNRTIVYYLDPSFSWEELIVIARGILEISTKTCIRFQYYDGSQPDFVNVVRGVSGSGCSSAVGRRGGSQNLNLAMPGCLRMGVVAHEFIHALGYRHEQCRTDRDDYVIIQWDNIQEGKENNFRRYTAEEVDPFGVPYDYDSIMHYGRTSFAIVAGEDTITPLEDDVSIGQRLSLSPKDIAKINNMYNCTTQ